jgi:predicted secreted Zn-dependent protease
LSRLVNKPVRHPGITWRRRLTLIAAPFTAAWPILASAQNSLHWTTNYYSVTGAVPREIRQSINRSRPWKSSTTDALTSWRVEWRFAVVPTSGGCRCSAFSTTTTIAITMPRWMLPAGVDPSAKARWERYIRALGEHENGHAQLALAAAAEMQKRIKALGEQPDCEGLRSRINDTGNAVLEDFRKRENDYDERTKHGATQGASLP